MDLLRKRCWALTPSCAAQAGAVLILLCCVGQGKVLAASFTPLGDLPGDTSFWSIGLGVSDDGLAVAGDSNSGSGHEAYRWTSGGGMVGLGDLTGGTTYSEAYAVSGDGSAVVGRGSSASGVEAFRWTGGVGGGMGGLGDLTGGGFYCTAHDHKARDVLYKGRIQPYSQCNICQWAKSNQSGRFVLVCLS